MKTKPQLEERINTLIFELGNYAFYVPPKSKQMQRIYDIKEEIQDYRYMIEKGWYKQ